MSRVGIGPHHGQSQPVGGRLARKHNPEPWDREQSAGVHVGEPKESAQEPTVRRRDSRCLVGIPLRRWPDSWYRPALYSLKQFQGSGQTIRKEESIMLSSCELLVFRSWA